MRERREAVKKAREESKRLKRPYWSNMPDRFAQYEITKTEKIKESKRNAKSQERAMRNKKFNKFPRNFDWESYFKAKQDRFKAQLDKKKAACRLKMVESEFQEFDLSVSRFRPSEMVSPLLS